MVLVPMIKYINFNMKDIILFLNEALKAYSTDAFIKAIYKYEDSLNDDEKFLYGIKTKSKGNIKSIFVILKGFSTLKKYKGKFDIKIKHVHNLNNHIEELTKLGDKFGYELTLSSPMGYSYRDGKLYYDVNWAKFSNEEKDYMKSYLTFQFNGDDYYKKLEIENHDLYGLYKKEEEELSPAQAAYKEGYMYQLVFEPKYGEIITKFIKSECNNKIYHFTDSKNINSILKNGLRIRNRTELTENDIDTEHVWSERIYFIYSKPDELEKNLKKVWDEIDLSSAVKYGQDQSLLEIDISNINFDFYVDTFTKTYCCCYCVNNIPAKFIKVLDYTKEKTTIKINNLNQ